MKRSSSRFLTTHVGNLVKTPEIIDAMRAEAMGEAFDRDAFARHLRAGVRQVVRKQHEVGIDVPSDGKFGKSSWMGCVWERLDDLELSDRAPRDADWFALRNAQFRGFQRAYERVETTMWMPDLPSGKKPENANILRLFACTSPIRYKGHPAIRRDIENFKTALADGDFAEAFLPVVALQASIGNESIAPGVRCTSNVAPPLRS